MLLLLLSALTIQTTGVFCKLNTQNQEWGYYEVRPGAHMFWWLAHTKANVLENEERPLLIWLQGGPGAPSSGNGNFLEIGPYGLDFTPRQYTWTNRFNVLFVDSPVGTGYSYANDSAKLTENVEQIALDLVALLRSFYGEHEKLASADLYVFGQSYGGKCAVVFAEFLLNAMKRNEIVKLKFKGIGLGDAWISPIDSVKNWGPYLYHFGKIDEKGLDMINNSTNEIEHAMESGLFENATELWSDTEHLLLKLTNGTSFYNVLLQDEDTDRQAIQLETVMNGEVKSLLGIPDFVVWHGVDNQVFSKHSADFMKPVIDSVENILNNTDLSVIVYSGQFDVIVETTGTLHWLNQLKWPGKAMWYDAVRAPILVEGKNEGFMKKVGKLSFYWVNEAGHGVPADNPKAMELVLENLLNEKASVNGPSCEPGSGSRKSLTSTLLFLLISFNLQVL